ncbi:MAG TPA: hypothetical protein VFT62_01100 [Mycobacteriales bacterium]|nr:hypothetical protein [Mycobacteriales bacterium]
MTTSPVMHLLDRGVPLTLLLDLADPCGPDSRAINAAERPISDGVWPEVAGSSGHRAATA